MRLTVLGSSGTFAGPDDACSGYLVEHDGFRLVMDVGPGTLANLQRHLPLDRIDAVDGDVFRSRPVLSPRDWLRVGWRTLVPQGGTA